MLASDLLEVCVWQIHLFRMKIFVGRRVGHPSHVNLPLPHAVTIRWSYLLRADSRENSLCATQLPDDKRNAPLFFKLHS